MTGTVTPRLQRVLAALALAVLVAPQLPVRAAQTTDREPTETKVFYVRFKPVEDIVLLVRNLLGDDGSVTIQPRLKAVTISDQPHRLRRIEEVIRAFDVPPRQVHLAVQLILGTQRKQTGSPDERMPPRRRILPGIDEEVDGLIRLTPWTDYELLGSASFTAAEGEESTVALGPEYRVRLIVGSVNPETSYTRFERFALERHRRGADGTVELQPIWNQVLNLRDEQLYLFGATRLEESHRAIFFSVTAGIVR